MTVKSVHKQARSDIPHRKRFIRRRRQKRVVKFRKIDVVYRINMASESVSGTTSGHIIQPTRVVHIPRNQEIPIMIKINAPHWLRMVLKRMRTFNRHKAPNLNCPVSTACGEVSALRIERHVGYPLTVPFSAHDQISLRQRPNLPRHII